MKNYYVLNLPFFILCIFCFGNYNIKNKNTYCILIYNIKFFKNVTKIYILFCGRLEIKSHKSLWIKAVGRARK
ncbi:hypothetical protein BA920_02770 [Helicobacter pullorum]|nr:hypothetical protein BA920_02770 [Helicobacter pullorum]